MVAEDSDEGASGQVRYAVNSSVFTVDPYSGWVTTVTLLDREQTPRHTLLVTAYDAGDPPLSSTALLHVDILDYNDSPPIFSQASYTASGKRNSMNYSAHDEIQQGDTRETDGFEMAIVMPQIRVTYNIVCFVLCYFCDFLPSLSVSE